MFPPIKLEIKNGDSTYKIIETNKVNLKIYSISNSLEYELKEMKDYKPINLNNWFYISIFMMLFFISIITLFLIYNKAKSRHIKNKNSNIYKKKPIIIAIEELNNLKLKSAELFYLELSHIFRSYLKGVLYYNITEMTSLELIDLFKELNVEVALIDEITNFIKHLDFGKYSNENYDQESMATDRIKLIKIIKDLDKYFEKNYLNK